MSIKIEKILKVFLFGVALFVAINWFIQKPNNIADYVQIIFESSGASTLLVIFYNKFLWKIDPTNDLPNIGGNYTGHIVYRYDSVLGNKEIKVKISQTFLDVNVSIITDEITSSTITSEIIKENSNYVIYYTYITNPKNEFSKNNPIQRGTCRLNIFEDQLEGSYWTTRKTTGDIKLSQDK